MGTHRTSLPGVGVQYDYTTESGQHISVVVHHDGRRFLGFYEKDDPDSCLLSVPLTTTEATGLAHLIDAAPIDAVRTEGIDLVTEHIPLGARSPYGGRIAGGHPGAHAHGGLDRGGAAHAQRAPFAGAGLPAGHRGHARRCRYA